MWKSYHAWFGESIIVLSPWYTSVSPNGDNLCISYYLHISISFGSCPSITFPVLSWKAWLQEAGGRLGKTGWTCRSKHDIKGMNEQWKEIVSPHVPISVVHYSYLIDILTRYGQCTPSLKLVPCTSQSLTKFIIFFIDSSLKFVRNIEKEVLHRRVNTSGKSHPIK